MALTDYEQYVLAELSRRFTLPPEHISGSLPPGFGLRTRGIGTQIELVPYPEAGIQGVWDIAADPTVPAGGGPGAIYEVIGADATRGGEDYSAGDMAIILGDGVTSRNITTFHTNQGSDPLTGWAKYADSTYTVGAPFNIVTPTITPLPNDGVVFVTDYLPSDTTSLYDGTNILATTEGESYVLTIKMKAEPSNNNTNLRVMLSDGTTDLIYRTFSMASASTVYDINLSTTFEVTADFITNGGTVNVSTDTTNVDIYDIEYTIVRTYSPAVSVPIPAAPVIAGTWDISIAGNNTVPPGAQAGYFYHVTPGTYPHTHTSGGGTITEDYYENDILLVVDTVTPIIRNISTFANLVGLSSVVQGTWDMDGTLGATPPGASQYDIYEIIGLDYTYSGNLYRAGDLAIIMSLGPTVVRNLTTGILNDAVTTANTAWSSSKIVNYLSTTFIDDVSTTSTTKTWSVAKIVSELALKATISDGTTSGTTTWSSNKITSELQAHSTNAALHFVINDTASTLNTVWSSQKLTSMFSAIGTFINDAALAGNTTQTWSADKLISALQSPLNTHISDVAKHRVINDAGAAVTDLWSASKITAYVTANAGAQINDAAGSGATTVTWSADKLYTDLVAGHVNDLGKHRTINDLGSAATDLWSASKIISAISAAAGVAINDAAGLGATTVTWSANKILTNFNSHANDTALHFVINDLATNSNETWSANKINSSLSAVAATVANINDAIISLSKTWSSTKINNEITSKVAALISDGITGASNTWSSTKIANAISTAVTGIDHTVLINDAATVSNQTWSSSKINTRIYTDFRAAVIRDDLNTSTNSTWSIDKIKLEIIGGAGVGVVPWVVLTSATTLVAGGRYMLDFDGGLFDVELPASPALGDADIVLWHIRGDVESVPTPPKVTRNTKNIDGVAQDLDFDVNDTKVTFAYTGIPSIGWKTAV